MPKDWPDFKSWKKLERYCKRTKTKCYVNDVKSGAACSRCYIKLSLKNKKGLRSPVYISRREKICRRCYKQLLIFLAKFFIFYVVFGALIFLILLWCWVFK